MNHGLTNDYLYTACKITATFTIDSQGKRKTVTGTSFFVKNKEDKVCLVTNRHVIDLNYKEKTGKYKEAKLIEVIVDCKTKDAKSGLPKEQYELLLHDIGKFKFSDCYENDIACLIEVRGFDRYGRQNPRIDFCIDHSAIANEEDFKKIIICDFVAFPGFPEWYDKRNNLPILRTGSIASDPRFDYSDTAEYIGEAIAYEAFSHDGSSGSPIYAIEKGIRVGNGLTGGGHRDIMMIGINAGHLKNYEGHSGISYFYKAPAILKIIQPDNP